MNKNTETFNEKGYCVVKNAIPEELRDFITQYALFDEMQDFTPDQMQVVGAHSKYADPAMETMLIYLHKQMEENTGLSLSPTYSFYRVYREGDELAPHKDRESCEISCTVCFNYSYDSSEYEWPIFMENFPAVLEPGDLVTYRGCDLEHQRESFAPGKDHWQVQGFFHYVDKNGPFSHFEYDQRETLGQLKSVSTGRNNTRSYIEYTA